MTGGSAEVGAAYDASATAWANGPDRMYRRLAEAMLAHCPVPVAGARVLDVGAGTGAAARAALAAGAGRVVATDLSPGMLRALTPTAVPRVAADITALPFTDRAFDLVTAACVVGHLPDPVAALVEIRRVADALVATAFGLGPPHPAKAAVDDAMRAFGFVPPPWYLRLKQSGEPLVENPNDFRALAAAAGWSRSRVAVVDVPSGLRTAEAIAAWRLGMAHLAPFLASLPDGSRTLAVRAAQGAVAGIDEPVIQLVVLSAR